MKKRVVQLLQSILFPLSCLFFVSEFAFGAIAKIDSLFQRRSKQYKSNSAHFASTALLLTSKRAEKYKNCLNTVKMRRDSPQYGNSLFSQQLHNNRIYCTICSDTYPNLLFCKRMTWSKSRTTTNVLKFGPESFFPLSIYCNACNLYRKSQWIKQSRCHPLWPKA